MIWRVLNRSLMWRLVSHFLLLSLLIVALAGSLTFLGTRKTLRDSVIDRLDVLAALGEEQLLRWVANQRQDVVFLAALPEVADLAAELFETGGEEESKQAAREHLHAFLLSSVELKPQLGEVQILSADGGRVVACTDGKHEGEYRVHDSHFVRGLQGTFVQNVYPAPETFLPTLTISTPLRGPTGEPLGVLLSHLDLKELDRILKVRTGLHEEEEIYLVDRFNAFVSGTQFGRESFRRGVRSEAIQAAISGDDGSGLYENYEGTPVIGVYRWIDDLDLALLVEISEEEALAPAGRVAARILGMGLAMVLLFTVGTLILARQIVRPILRLKETALRVSEGDLEATAPITTEDEIGLLADTFNRMTGRLSELYSNLHREIDQRRRTEEELVAKNAELERFTYTVSHDLKSPLVTISGFLSFLEKDALAGNRDRIQRDVDRIRTAAESMARLLDELLKLSRVGRMVNEPEDVPLTPLVEQVGTLLAGALGERQVELVIAPDLPVVSGDPTRLLEVFQNLIDNAIKFMGGREDPRIEVGVREVEEEEIIFVQDNGIGIDPRFHDKVFGLFECLDDRRATDRGTGVGLALVKRIVEVHGGRVWVESEGVGKGSTFCFTLPGAEGA